MKAICIVVVTGGIVLTLGSNTFSQETASSQTQSLETQIQELEERLDRVESKASRADEYVPFILILFGAFSALWAQNTGRNPWLWFFLGYVFSIVTVIVILVKNPGTRPQR